jgi:hypothetical protein
MIFTASLWLQAKLVGQHRDPGTMLTGPDVTGRIRMIADCDRLGQGGRLQGGSLFMMLCCGLFGEGWAASAPSRESARVRFLLPGGKL